MPRPLRAVDGGRDGAQAVFDSSFDSGNGCDFECVAPWQFVLRTRADCEGSAYATGNSTWFYFSVANVPAGQVIKLTVLGLNPQRRLFEQGLKPVWRSLPGHPRWERVSGTVNVAFDSPSPSPMPTPLPGVRGTADKAQCSVSWQHSCAGGSGEAFFFAFCYPYSLEETRRYMASLERRLVGEPRARTPDVPEVPESGSLACDADRAALRAPAARGGPAPAAPVSGPAPVPALASPSATASAQRRVYFHRCTLARSLQGRAIELVTITNRPALVATAQHRAQQAHELARLASLVREHPFMFPRMRCLRGGAEGASEPSRPQRRQPDSAQPDSEERQQQQQPDSEQPDGEERPSEVFPGKPVVFVSARVHPGETPSQFCLEGLLELVSDLQDPRGERLRELFVFKVVPVLNPDGVALGHYRCDSLGANLNRSYHCASAAAQPAIAAVCQVLRLLSQPWALNSSSSVGLAGLPPGSPAAQAALASQRRPLFLYLDMHAHANKRGCFLFGNKLADGARQVANVSYSRLVALNTPFLDLAECDFSHKSKRATACNQETSKEGSGRVSVHAATGITHCYTLECNYNSGKALNVVPPHVALPAGLLLKLGGNGGGVGSGWSRGSSTGKSAARVYGPDTWADVGRACAVAMLDLVAQNPLSRLERSPYKSLDGVRADVERDLRAARDQAGKRGGGGPASQQDQASSPATSTSASSLRVPSLGRSRGSLTATAASSKLLAQVAPPELELRRCCRPGT